MNLDSRSKNAPAGEYWPVLLPVVFLFAFSSPALTQPLHPDTLQASIDFRKADSLQKSALYDSSSHYFNRAIAAFREQRIWTRTLDGLMNLAENRIQSGNYDGAAETIGEVEELVEHRLPESPLYRIRACRLWGRFDNARAKYPSALNWFDKASDLLAGQPDDLPKLHASILSDIGDVYDNQGRYDRALEQYFNALDLYSRQAASRDRSFVSRLYNNIGVAYQNKGDHQQALEFYRKSLDIEKEIWDVEHPDIAKGYNNMAIVYYYQGDYRRALDHMKKATQTLSGYFGQMHPQVAAGYNNIGIVFSEMDRLEEAIDYLEKSIEIKTHILGDVHTDVAIGYQNLGALYYDLEKYDSAIGYYLKALNLHRQIFDGPHPEIANTYANLGEAYSQKSDYGKALKYLQKDLEMNRLLLGERHPFIGDTYNTMGHTYALQENYPLAIDHFDRAISVLAGEPGDSEAIADLKLESVSHPVLLLEALENKGVAHRSSYDETGNVDQLEQALNTFLRASMFIESLQVDYRSDVSKLLLGRRSFDMYEAGLESAYTLHQSTGDPRYLRYALHFAERSKARVLLGQLMEMNAKNFAGIPDTLIAYEQALRRRLTRLNGTVRERTGQSLHIDSLDISAQQDSIFALKQKLKNHIRHLEKNYPKYYQLKYEQVSVDPAFIQDRLLGAGQTLVEYFYGDEALFAFTISRERIELHKMETDTALTSRLREFRTAITENNRTAYSALGSNLYRRIFQPLEGSIDGESVLIVPDGFLNYVPFEALLTQPDSVNGLADYRNAPFLAKKFEISYAPSATFLQYSKRHFGEQTFTDRVRFLGFAPVFSSLKTRGADSSDAGRTTLPLSRYEVEQIASLIEKPDNLIDRIRRSNRSTVFVRSEATESVFKEQQLDRYNVIHLATHAFVGKEAFEESGIAFSPRAGSSNDGVLHLNEIYNLSLDADLVVLSACDTGIGSVIRGEGVLSLARAFQYAGSRNLLVSLWQVNDRSAAELMLRFYESLLGGTSMPAALRKAKLELMNRPGFAAPRNWAPFILLGN